MGSTKFIQCSGLCSSNSLLLNQTTKLGKRGVVGRAGRWCLFWTCAWNNLLFFCCDLGINAQTGGFKTHGREKPTDACGKAGIASRVSTLEESKRWGLAFCPCSGYSLSVVVGDIRELLPPGPVHGIFEPLKRNSHGHSMHKCKRWRAFFPVSTLRHGWCSPRSAARSGGKLPPFCPAPLTQGTAPSQAAEPPEQPLSHSPSPPLAPQVLSFSHFPFL